MKSNKFYASTDVPLSFTIYEYGKSPMKQVTAEVRGPAGKFSVPCVVEESVVSVIVPADKTELVGDYLVEYVSEFENDVTAKHVHKFAILDKNTFPISATVLEVDGDTVTCGLFTGKTESSEKIEREGKSYTVIGEVKASEGIDVGTIILVGTSGVVQEGQTYKWSEPVFITVNSSRKEPMFVNDVLEDQKVALKIEGHQEHYGPKNSFLGMNVKDTMTQMQLNGRPYTPEEISFRYDMPMGQWEDGDVCGTCWFYDRGGIDESGKCQLMGNSVEVPWWYKSSGYINAGSQARSVLLDYY